MNKKPAICPHKNTVQSGTETTITTMCADCGEILKTEIAKKWRGDNKYNGLKRILNRSK